jgi:hypothetical protein
MFKVIYSKIKNYINENNNKNVNKNKKNNKIKKRCLGHRCPLRFQLKF